MTSGRAVMLHREPTMLSLPSSSGAVGVHPMTQHPCSQEPKWLRRSVAPLPALQAWHHCRWCYRCHAEGNARGLRHCGVSLPISHRMPFLRLWPSCRVLIASQSSWLTNPFAINFPRPFRFASLDRNKFPACPIQLRLPMMFTPLRRRVSNG